MSIFFWNPQPWLRAVESELYDLREDVHVLIDLVRAIQPSDLSREQQDKVNAIYERVAASAKKMEETLPLVRRRK